MSNYLLMFTIALILSLPALSSFASIPGRGFRCAMGVSADPFDMATRENLAEPIKSEREGIANYDDEITQPVGVTRSAKLTLKSGHSVPVEIIVIEELEARVNFPADDIRPVDRARALVWDFNPQQQHSLMAMLPEGSISVWEGDFYLAPLRSKFEQFHESFVNMDGMAPGPKKVRTWETGEEKKGVHNIEISAGQWDLKPLPAAPDGSWNQSSSRNFINIKYWIGWQKELGLYFDSVSGTLRKRGIAARVKAWYPKDSKLPNIDIPLSTEELNRSERWSITIKSNQDEPNGFTSRVEHHISLDSSNVTVAQLPEIIESALVELSLVDKNEKLNLSLVNRIDTERISLNIHSKKTEGVKIGFLTLDQFSRYRMEKGSAIFEGSQQQFEAEILPKYIPLYRKGDMTGIDTLVEAVRKRFSGQNERLPKYLQKVD